MTTTIRDDRDFAATLALHEATTIVSPTTSAAILVCDCGARSHGTDLTVAETSHHSHRASMLRIVHG